MDDVKRVQNLSKVLKTHLMLFPDPEFKPFDEPDSVKYYKSDYLTLNGKNLNRLNLNQKFFEFSNYTNKYLQGK